MNEKTERPELGTTEAAVRSCVNLIALATHTDEEHLAYWLDCYYQLRKAHEDRLSAEEARIQMENERAEILRSLLGRNDGPSRTPAPTEETVKSPQPATPAAPLASSRGAMSEGGSPEPPAAQKNRAPLTVSERRKLQNAEKEKRRIQGRSDWREFKRATFARLQEAKAGGLTIGAIVAASDGKVTENTVLDILNAAPRPIEYYRALDAALDELAKDKKTSSVTAEP